MNVLLPPLFFRFPFLHKSKNPKRFSPRRECLTQTGGSDQMELSQGCPVDCDTCMWVRVFHCHYIVVVSEKDRNACIVIMNRMLFFSPLKCICTQSILQKLTLYLNPVGKTPYFQVYFVCQAPRRQLSGPTLGCCCVCGRFGAARYSTGRLTTVGRGKKNDGNALIVSLHLIAIYLKHTHTPVNKGNVQKALDSFRL